VYDPELDSWSYRTLEDGLPSSTVRAVAGDEREIWFGTSAGVVVYHRVLDSWQQLGAAEGLRGTDVRDILLRGREAWIASWDGGLSSYNRDLGTWEYYTQEDVLPSDRVLCLHDDGSYMWVGCAEGGLVRYLRPTRTWRAMSGSGPDLDCPSSVGSVESGDGYLLVTSPAGGIHRLEVSSGEWSLFADADMRYYAPRSCSSGQLFGLWGGGLLDTASGTWLLDMDDGDLYSPWITCISDPSSPGDTLLVGLDRSGIQVLDKDEMTSMGMLPPPSEHALVSVGLDGGHVVATDSDGMTWRMEGGQGWEPVAIGVPVLPWWECLAPPLFALVTGDVTHATTWLDRIWVTERGNHLWSVSSSGSWFYHGRVAPLERGPVSDLVVAEGSLVASGDDGWICLIDSSATRCRRFSGPPGSVCCASGGTILCYWNGTVYDVSGARSLDDPGVAALASFPAEDPGSAAFSVTDAVLFDGEPFLLDGEGRVWHGTDRLSLARQAGSGIALLHVISDTLLLAYGEGDLRWTTTAGADTGEWSVFGFPGSPLGGNYLSSIREAGGFVWFLSGWGAYRWDPGSGAWRSFLPEDGLSTGAFSSVASCCGITFLGSLGAGLDALLPDGSAMGYGSVSEHLVRLPSFDVSSLASTDSLVLVGTANGMVLFWPASGRWFEVSPLALSCGGEPGEGFSSVDAGDEGVVIAASSGDLLLTLDLSSWEWRRRNPWGEGAAVSDVCVSRDYIWAGLTRGVVYALSRAGDFWYSYTGGVSIPNGSIRSVESSNEHVWIATSAGASSASFERYRPPAWLWFTNRRRAGRRTVSSALAAGLSNSSLLAVAPIWDDALVLTSSTLELFDRGSETWQTLLAFPRYSATSLDAEERDGTWAVGLTSGGIVTGSGLSAASDTTWIAAPVTCLELTDDGRLFAGTLRGGLYLDGVPIPDPPRTSPEPLSGHLSVEDLSFDSSSSRLWVASSEGLYSWSVDSESWQIWSGPP
jgi:hypothetical protein